MSVLGSGIEEIYEARYNPNFLLTNSVLYKDYSLWSSPVNSVMSKHSKMTETESKLDNFIENFQTVHSNKSLVSWKTHRWKSESENLVLTNSFNITSRAKHDASNGNPYKFSEQSDPFIENPPEGNESTPKLAKRIARPRSQNSDLMEFHSSIAYPEPPTIRITAPVMRTTACLQPPVGPDHSSLASDEIQPVISDDVNSPTSLQESKLPSMKRSSDVNSEVSDRNSSEQKVSSRNIHKRSGSKIRSMWPPKPDTCVEGIRPSLGRTDSTPGIVKHVLQNVYRETPPPSPLTTDNNKSSPLAADLRSSGHLTKNTLNETAGTTSDSENNQIDNMSPSHLDPACSKNEIQAMVLEIESNSESSQKSGNSEKSNTNANEPLKSKSFLSSFEPNSPVGLLAMVTRELSKNKSPKKLLKKSKYSHNNKWKKDDSPNSHEAEDSKPQIHSIYKDHFRNLKMILESDVSKQTLPKIFRNHRKKKKKNEIEIGINPYQLKDTLESNTSEEKRKVPDIVEDENMSIKTREDSSSCSKQNKSCSSIFSVENNDDSSASFIKVNDKAQLDLLDEGKSNALSNEASSENYYRNILKNLAISKTSLIEHNSLMNKQMITESKLPTTTNKISHNNNHRLERRSRSPYSKVASKSPMDGDSNFGETEKKLVSSNKTKCLQPMSTSVELRNMNSIPPWCSETELVKELCNSPVPVHTHCAFHGPPIAHGPSNQAAVNANIKEDSSDVDRNLTNNKNVEEDDKFWTFTTRVIFPKTSTANPDNPERDSLDGNLPGSSHGTTSGNLPAAQLSHPSNVNENPDGGPTSPGQTGFSKGPNSKNKKHKRLKNDPGTLDYPGDKKEKIKEAMESYEPTKSRDMESGGYRSKTEPYTYLWVVLSRMYGKLIVLLMLAFCLTEVLDNKVSPLTFQEVFMLYLYVGSIIAIMCIYVTVIIDNCPSITSSKENLTKSEDPESGSITSFGTLKRAHISRSKTSRTSFYLRVGALVFGLGTLIYNGLEIAMHSSIPEGCVNDTILAHPIMQALFTFLQMHFLFVNSEVIVEKFGQVARFGFMHLVATNLALWVRMVVWESASDWMDNNSNNGISSISRDGVFASPIVGYHAWELRRLHACYQNNSLGQLWSNSQPYLLPFLVQYSLIAASVTYIMWCNVGKEKLRKLSSFNKSLREIGDTLDKRIRKGRWKVDCRSASKGLFLGLLVLVGGIVILIIFFVMKGQEDFRTNLFWMCNGTMMTILSLCIIATIFGFIQIPKLSISTYQPMALDRLLLSTTVIGVYIFSIFGMIVGGIEYHKPEKLATFCTNSLLLVQVSLQGMLVAEASRRTCTNRYQMLTKPGRQVITFLLFSNITLWVLDTFMTHNSITHEFQINFYGKVVWGVISRISLPLMILFRFHSAVILVEIWKNTYRTKTD